MCHLCKLKKTPLSSKQFHFMEFSCSKKGPEIHSGSTKMATIFMRDKLEGLETEFAEWHAKSHQSYTLYYHEINILLNTCRVIRKPFLQKFFLLK